jgi:hypothetical protein
MPAVNSDSSQPSRFGPSCSERTPVKPAELDSILDSLARMADVIKSDKILRNMFLSLAKKSVEERRGMIAIMSESMLADGRDADLIASFRLLSDPRVFQPALIAVTSE